MTEVPYATPSAVAIIETDDCYLTEQRPNIPGRLAHSGRIGLFGGHVEPNQTPYDAIRAELDQELGLQFIGPLRLLGVTDVDSQDRFGNPARRRVSLFHITIDSETNIEMKVPGEIIKIPKAADGVEQFKNKLTTFSYNALAKVLASNMAIKE